MLECGLRLQEVVNLDYEDINEAYRFIIIRNSKNNKSRYVQLPDECLFLIKNYSSGTTGPVFRDRFSHNRISDNAIKLMFQKLKVVCPRVHAHLLRHTFATSFIMGGGNLEILRNILGHESYNVTKYYISSAYQMQIIHYPIYRISSIFFNSSYVGFK